MVSLGIMHSVNSTAALMVDGKIVACGCEDRFVGRKSIHAYPKHSVEFCLDCAGVSSEQIDCVVLPYKDFALTAYEKWMVNYDADFSMQDKIREQYQYYKPLLIEGKQVDFLDIFKDKIIPERMDVVKRSNGRYFLKTCIEDHLGIRDDRIVMLDHHLSHIFYAIYTNRDLKTPCLVFNMEGYGGESNGSIVLYKDGKLKTLYKTPYCWIGRLYRYITLLLGMKSNEHEYKVMGLAPYASEYIIREPLEVFRQTACVDGLAIKFKMKPKDIYFHFKEKLEPYRFDAIAGALQRYTEEIICQWVKNAVAQTKVKDIMFTGGVAMNIKAMMVLADQPEVGSLWVGATSSDESLSMGVLYQHAYNEGISIKPLDSIYIGNQIGDDEIRKFIKTKDLETKHRVIYDVDDAELAARLEKGEVLARFSGRAEFGARALGNRSILANPAAPNIVRVINEKIKNRDFWMPFAPVILHERQHDYIINPKNIDSPYMTIGFKTSELAKSHLPAALHPYDYTARPQIIKEEDNPQYHSIIKAFEKRTGIGALLNTSFNLHGEPIVNNLEDALRVFEVSKLDLLQLGRHLIIKNHEEA